MGMDRQTDKRTNIYSLFRDKLSLPEGSSDRHKTGSVCFVPDITSASPQVVSMQFFKCLFDTELEIFASMINV